MKFSQTKDVTKNLSDEQNFICNPLFFILAIFWQMVNPAYYGMENAEPEFLSSYLSRYMKYQIFLHPMLFSAKKFWLTHFSFWQPNTKLIWGFGRQWMHKDEWRCGWVNDVGFSSIPVLPQLHDCIDVWFKHWSRYITWSETPNISFLLSFWHHRNLK